MQKTFSLMLAALGAAGCLTTTPPEGNDWPVEAAVSASSQEAKRFDTVRLLGIAVRAPFDTRSIAVRRAGGTLAFDPYNSFAATPSQLLRGPSLDILAGSGLCKTVVGPGSIAPTPVSAEIDVADFSLDCRTEGQRTAVVKLTFRLIDRTQGLLKAVVGVGTADAASGDYGAAFSSAYSTALATALSQL